MAKKKTKAARVLKPKVNKKTTPTKKKGANVGKKTASVDKADVILNGNDNLTGDAKPKRLRKMTPKQKDLQETLLLKQMKASPSNSSMRKLKINLTSVTSKRFNDTSVDKDAIGSPLNKPKNQDDLAATPSINELAANPSIDDLAETQTIDDLAATPAIDDLAETPTIDDNLMEIFGEISTLQSFELQDAIDTVCIEDENNVSKQDVSNTDIEISKKSFVKDVKENNTGALEEINEQRGNDSSQDEHVTDNENEVKDTKEIFGKKISKKMFGKPKGFKTPNTFINDSSEVVEQEIISKKDKVSEAKTSSKKNFVKKGKDVKIKETKESNNEDQKLLKTEMTSLAKEESSYPLQTPNTHTKKVSVSIVDDKELDWIKDILIILPTTKEDKIAAKLKKESELDKLEEDLRRMHPEENEEEQSKPMELEQQNLSKLEELSHHIMPKLENKPNKSYTEQLSPFSKPKQVELSPKKKTKQKESGQLNHQKVEKSNHQNIPKPMEPIQQNLHKLSYAELILQVESSVAQIAELEFKNANLEELTRVNKEKVAKLQKRPSKDEVADILQKLENTNKENQTLKKKISSFSVKETSESKEMEFNAIKEKAEKEKTEIIERCKSLENKNFQLKEANFKLQAKQSHQKDKSDGGKLLEPEDKSRLDKNKLKSENSKLNDQISRLKSSNLGKENTIKRLEEQLCKVKEEHKNLELEVQANRSTKEQNKFLERINKTNTEKIKKLEYEGSQAANQHKEFVALRRENYEKNHIIQDLKIQMATFESNNRKAQAEMESLQKNIVDLNNDKKSLNIELGRVMKENINLLEDKKKMIEGNKELLELQMKYKASKQTLEKYIEKYRWCKDNHHKVLLSKPASDTIVTGNLVQSSLQRPAASSTPSLSRPVASSTPALSQPAVSNIPAVTKPVASSTPALLPAKSGSLPLPGGLPLPENQSDIRPSVDEDEAPYDPEADIHNIFDTKEAADIIHFNQSTVSEASFSEKNNEKETGTGWSFLETSIQDIPSGRISREPNVQDITSVEMSRESSVQDLPTGRSSRSSIIQDDEVPPPPRIRDQIKNSNKPALFPDSPSPQEIPLPSPPRIRVLNTPLLRDPRQRRRQASGEGKGTKDDKEVPKERKSEVPEESLIVPHYYTPSKILPHSLQPDMSIAESTEEVSTNSTGHRIEAWQAFHQILNQEISPHTKISPKEEYVEKVDLKEESVVILVDTDQVKSRQMSSASNRQTSSSSNRKNRKSRSSSPSSKSSSRDSSRHGSRSKKTFKKEQSRSKSRSREKRSRKRSRSNSRKRKRSLSKTRRRHNSRSRNRSKRSGSRTKKKSSSQSRRRSSSRSKRRSRSKSRSGRRSSKLVKRSRSNSEKTPSSNSKERKKSVSPDDIRITKEFTKVQPRKGYSTSQLKDILVNNVDSVIKELTDQIIKTDNIPLPPTSGPPPKTTTTTITPTITVPFPAVTSIPTVQPILWGPLQDAVNSIAQQQAAVSSIAQQQAAVSSISHQQAAVTNIAQQHAVVSSFLPPQLSHMHPPVNMPSPLHLPGLNLQHGVPSFIQDTSVPPPGFSEDKFPKDKINQQFAVDLGDFMYAKGGESKGKVGGQMGKGCLPRPVSSAPTSTASKGFTGSNPDDNVALKKYYLAPDIHPTASTVQWKDYCSSCGDFVIDKDDHFVESKEDVKPSEGAEATERICKKINEIKQSTGKVLCKMCDSEEHIVNGCPLLSSFCYKCWCWGHTDSMHDKCPPFYILHLKRNYNMNRQELHLSSKKHMHSMPVNVFANNLCKYPGSVTELAMLASKLLPEGLFQPWLHPEWNKCKYKGF